MAVRDGTAWGLLAMGTPYYSLLIGTAEYL